MTRTELEQAIALALQQSPVLNAEAHAGNIQAFLEQQYAFAQAKMEACEALLTVLNNS